MIRRAVARLLRLSQNGCDPRTSASVKISPNFCRPGELGFVCSLTISEMLVLRRPSA